MGKKLTAFQRTVITNDGNVDVLEILREYGDRLKAIMSYPPIVPAAGQALHDILNELEEALDVRRSNESDSTESSSS